MERILKYCSLVFRRHVNNSFICPVVIGRAHRSRLALILFLEEKSVVLQENGTACFGVGRQMKIVLKAKGDGGSICSQFTMLMYLNLFLIYHANVFE